MTILQSGIAQAAASGSYQIARSLRFNSADSAYLTRTPGTAGNQQKFTISAWVKKSRLGGTEQCIFNARSGANTPRFRIMFNTNDTLQQDSDNFGQLTTTQVFRDSSAWYHIVFAADSTQATDTNRKKLYVNGVQITAFATPTYPAQNASSSVNSTQVHDIGVEQVNAIYFSGYMADVRLIDGQQLDPTSFGEFDANTGVWNPKTYSGTYGTNGFWLKLDDNSGVTATTLGKDSSGNGNNWTPNNFSVTAGVGNDSLVDSPTNYGTDTGAGGEVRGNYMTINPLSIPTNSVTLTNGNLDFSAAGTNAAKLGTFLLPTTGKWYWEVTCNSGGSGVWLIGISNSDDNNGTSGRLMYSSSGSKFSESGGFVSYGASYTTGDVIGVAVDMDAATLTFYKNNTSQGTAFSSITTTYLTKGIVAYFQGENSGRSMTLNAGQRPFAYTAPSGFKALCTQNLPTPAIGATSSTLAGKNMNVALYTGNGTSSATTQAITGVGFQPDLVWIKNRASAAYHVLTDAVRGTSAILSSNATDTEASFDASWRSSYGQLTAFGSDGFTVAAGSVAGGNFNYSGQTYVGWAFKGGNGTVSNTSGTITSTVSANPTAGISIVGYTGTGANATVGHGLGVAPKMVILKSRSAVKDWIVGSSNYTSWAYIQKLNDTIAQTSVTDIFNSTAPTSSVFSLGGNLTSNTSGATYIAYCFAEVAGFSKFGTYTGNGSADGPFAYCGFRPRYIMLKRTDSAGDWWVIDTARSTYNVAPHYLMANTTAAEASDNAVDILSNGFKLRVATYQPNTSGGTFMFVAFAEHPFQYSRAR